MKSESTTDVAIRRQPRFGANVVKDAERRQNDHNGTESVQDKVSLNDFLNENDLTATQKTTLLRVHTNVTTKLINVKLNCFEIGEELFDAKKILAHGQFMLYIKYFFANDLPYSTAYFYMRVYEVFQDTPQLVKYIPTTHLLMMSHKDFPKELLNDLKKYCERIDNKDLKHVKELYSMYKKGRIRRNQFVQLAKEQMKIGMAIASKSTQHRINSITRMSYELGAGDILKRIRELRQTAREMAGLYPYDPTSEGHKNLMEDIDKTIEELQKLKADLEGGDKFWRTVSTENGEKQISNF